MWKANQGIKTIDCQILYSSAHILCPHSVEILSQGTRHAPKEDLGEGVSELSLSKLLSN